MSLCISLCAQGEILPGWLVLAQGRTSSVRVGVWLDAADTQEEECRCTKIREKVVNKARRPESLRFSLNPGAACETIKDREERCSCGAQR